MRIQRLSKLMAAAGLASVQMFVGYTSALAKPVAPNLAAQGRKLYAQLQCAQCHSIKDVGGCIAPQLDGVTKRRSEQYLRLRLGANKEDAFIKLIGHPELFPHPRFAPAQATAIIAYLKTLSPAPAAASGAVSGHNIAIADDKPAPGWKPGEVSPSSREGRRLFLETGCMSCHAVGNTGGASAPALDGIGGRRGRAFIEAHVTDPTAHMKEKRQGKSQMVQPELQPDQVRSIVDFLLTLPPLKK